MPLRQITAWDLLDPGQDSYLKDFLSLTKSIEHTFAEDDLWTRFQTVAEGLGIPLSALLNAYHEEGSL
jgi:hypothetical protein